MLTIDDWERARIVDDDLVYLIDSWRPSLDEGSLRRDSPMLRRLLVDGQYAHAWRDLGLPAEPYISAPDIGAGLGDTTRTYVQFATAAPGVTVSNSLLAGGQVQMGVLQDVPPGSGIAVVPGYGQQFGLILVAIPPEVMDKAENREEVISSHLKPGRRHIVAQPLSQFLTSTFALILGTEITRREVIQYVAHKLGGAHFDPDRGRKGDDRLELLDRLARTRLEVNAQQPVNAVYVELLSIAESLAESGDAFRFRDVFRKTPRPI